MVYFDRFDICAAYEALEHDFGIGGVLAGRKRQVASQLHRMKWSGGPWAGDSQHLEPNGREIYDQYVARNYNMKEADEIWESHPDDIETAAKFLDNL